MLNCIVLSEKTFKFSWGVTPNNLPTPQKPDSRTAPKPSKSLGKTLK